MDARKRQLVGYLTAAAVVLAIATGFGAGYGLGYRSEAGSDQATPPRPLPKNACALIPKDTRNRTVPWAGRGRAGAHGAGTDRIDVTCDLATDPTIAQTYNEAELKVRVDRYGAMGMANRTEAADRAMRKIMEQVTDARQVNDLGDRAIATSRKRGPRQWATSVRVQYGDTIVSIDYATKLSDGSDTRSAAVAVAREILASLS